MIVRDAVVAFLVGAVAVSAAAESREELQEQVRRTEIAFAKTMADRDYAAFQTFLAEDTVFFGRAATPMRGKEQVAATWRRYFEPVEAPFSWAPDTSEVLATGDLALSSGPVLSPTGERIGTFNSIWRRERDGRWRIVFDKGCPPCAP